MGKMERECRILVVDDELDLCEILKFNLKNVGYEVETACSAEEALEKMDGQGVRKGHGCPFQLVLLDIMMPGMSGFELARLLRKQERTAAVPIIFLTAKDKEDDLLLGFSLGADDYIAKPFSVKEVLARVRAVLHRSQLLAEPLPGLEHEGLKVDLERKTVEVDGMEVAMTKTEFDLLCVLLSRRGHVFSRGELIGMVWPQKVIVTDRTVDVNITRLRKKIGRYAAHIIARQGFGYVFEVS